MNRHSYLRWSAPLPPVALLIYLFMAGCAAVGPNYKRPDVTTDAQFRSQVGPTEANSLADLPWWKVFDDKALQDLITQALTDNYDLEAALARIAQARALVTVARADLYPQFGYEASAVREKSFFPFEFGGRSGNITYNSFELALNSTWELDLWGRIRRTEESARAQLFAQQDIRRGVMLTLVSDVATSYFRLIELDRQLGIATESADVYKRTLALFSQRFDAGRDSRLAVVRAQAAYDSSRVNIAQLNRAIAQQENAISVLLGTQPRAIARGAVLTQQRTPKTPLGQTTEIINRRPDILQAEHTMMAANAEVGVAVANFYPRIGLSALFGGQAPHIEDVFDRNFNIWQIGGGLAGPIFQGGRLRANYDANKAFWDESIAQYKKTIVGAFREISDALIAQQTLEAQRAALESQVRALRDSVDLATTRYTVGRASYFEVLQAQQELFPSEQALAQTQRDQLLAVVNLYKALGGGWNLDDAAWPQPK
ncbi:efflux transporter outer membrane subunit [Steroidobacter cummioxidans]|uniref:efflux transporter outer membrane subunit n=1 Tax=Steroidobacter cummioxidans TaxID=1803913 RepID=UPI00129033C1|nr:efflux transporter outer membrane subunit [Steroidobacter cummioxidans]